MYKYCGFERFSRTNLFARISQTNVENSLKSGITQAKILYCGYCNATSATDTAGGMGTIDAMGTRVITIIEATDELDGNMVMSSNAIFGGGGGAGDKSRLKRGVEAASLAGNETVNTEDEDAEASLTDDMAKANPTDVLKPAPIKRDADNGGGGDMTQAIMEPRLDYDVDEEFRASNGHGYDIPRTRPVNNYVNNYRDYGGGGAYSRQKQQPGTPAGRPVDPDDERLEADDDDNEDIEDGDHNSHYEYVPMEFDDHGNHR